MIAGSRSPSKDPRDMPTREKNVWMVRLLAIGLVIDVLESPVNASWVKAEGFRK